MDRARLEPARRSRPFAVSPRRARQALRFAIGAAAIVYVPAMATYLVYFERCFNTANTNKVTWEYVFDGMRQVDPATSIMSSDLGQSTNPYLEEGVAQFVGRALDAGFSEAEMRQMIGTNPGQLLGAI